MWFYLKFRTSATEERIVAFDYHGTMEQTGHTAHSWKLVCINVARQIGWKFLGDATSEEYTNQ
jgi:hypothetical protein